MKTEFSQRLKEVIEQNGISQSGIQNRNFPFFN